MQGYLKEWNSVEAKTLIKYRLRMSQYAGNFRGDRPTSQCPLCGSHDDEQQLSFTCPVVMNSVKIDANYEEIYHFSQQKNTCSCCYEVGLHHIFA